MRLFAFVCLLWGVCLLRGVGAEAQKIAWPEKVASKINQIKNTSPIKSSNWALWLQRVSDSRVLYQHNADQLFTPASVTKLFAGGAFLEHLPLHFSTGLWATGAIEGGVLKGDLYLKGGGDAGFVSESMWELVRSLARTRIKKIEGHIVVDASLFPSSVNRPPASERAYGAPISAMLFNWSVMNIYIRGGDSLGAPAWVDMDPGPTAVQLINKATTGRRTQALKLRRWSGKIGGTATGGVATGGVATGGIAAGGLATGGVAAGGLATGGSSLCVRDRVEVTGQVSQYSKERLLYRSVTRPSCWAGFNLIDFLNLYNIQVQNKVRVAKVPLRGRLLVEQKSKPLPEQVHDMMKFSNNTMTEVLYQHFKLRALADKGGTGLEAQSFVSSRAEALARYIRSIGVEDFKLDSVSGLSRQNKFKARDVSAYLLRMRGHPMVGVDFMASLPVSGGVGTLDKRLVTSHTKGRVRAKTGMLNGVAALAGFVAHPVQGDLVFAYFFNGPHAQTEKGKQLIDHILTQVLKP